MYANPTYGEAWSGHPVEDRSREIFADERRARRYDDAARLNDIILAVMRAGGYSATEAASHAMEEFPDVIRQTADNWIEERVRRVVGDNPPYGMATEQNIIAARRQVERENPLVVRARDEGYLNGTILGVLIPKLGPQVG
jgi:hypothetical protein